MGNTQNRTRAAARRETDGERLRRTATADAMGVDLVSAFAGDREMTGLEESHTSTLLAARGNVFYSDLLYAISHHYFAPEIAEGLWEEVIRHKRAMSELLHRNVNITVATLDYFSSVASEIQSPTVISEATAAELANLSMRDGMTHLYNHSSFYELLELEFKGQRRHGAGLSLILMDIDDFKRVNDRHGHQQGDRVLTEVATTMSRQLRDSDICCRFGGEEFVAILPFTTNAAEALEIAERVRVAITTITCGDTGITVSVGVAVCGPETTSHQHLVDRADRALYLAKTNGKNRVELAED